MLKILILIAWVCSSLLAVDLAMAAATRPSTRPMAKHVVILSDGSSMVSFFWESEEAFLDSSGKNVEFREMHSRVILRDKDRTNSDVVVSEDEHSEESSGLVVFQPESSLLAASLTEDGKIVFVTNEWGRGVVKVAARNELGKWFLLPQGPLPKGLDKIWTVEEENLGVRPVKALVVNTNNPKVVSLSIDLADLRNGDHREFTLLFDDKGWHIEQGAPRR
jgi:hypothetical protein